MKENKNISMPEEPPFGEPPFEDPSFEEPPLGEPPFEEPPFGSPATGGPSGPTRKFRPVETMVRIVAATDRLQMPSARSVFEDLEQVCALLARLDRRQKRWPTLDATRAVVERLVAYTVEAAHGEFRLTDVPAWTDVVDRQLASIRAAKPISGDQKAAANALLEMARRIGFIEAADRAVGAAKDGASTAELDRLYKDVPPPSARAGVTLSERFRSAEEWFDIEESRRRRSGTMSLSSGLPHLDLAYSQLCSDCGGSGKDSEGNTCRSCHGAGVDSPGFIRPGEVFVIGAGSGHGKSSFTRALLPALAWDLRNYGMPESKVFAAITEEEPHTVARATGLHAGGQNAEVADQVVIAKIGSSRKAFVMALYELVDQAERRSQETGLPVTTFLPRIAILDYLQAVVEPGEDRWTTGVTRTSELMMRGIAAFDPDEMAKHGGIGYEEHIGRPWPDGLGHHRVAALSTAQLRQMSDRKAKNWKPGSSIEGFVSFDPRSGDPLWDVHPGDFRIPEREDLAGAGTIVNDAHGVFFLHRSNTGAVRVDSSSGAQLSDSRSRFILDKARSGATSPAVPMAFNLTPDGSRARFYDYRADAEVQALKEGLRPLRAWRWEPNLDVYKRPGDPILPVRTQRSPLAGIRYKR